MSCDICSAIIFFLFLFHFSVVFHLKRERERERERERRGVGGGGGGGGGRKLAVLEFRLLLTEPVHNFTSTFFSLYSSSQGLL